MNTVTPQQSISHAIAAQAYGRIIGVTAHLGVSIETIEDELAKLSPTCKAATVLAAHQQSLGKALSDLDALTHHDFTALEVSR